MGLHAGGRLRQPGPDAAYRSALDAIRDIGEACAEAFRRTTRRWRGRELREPLDKAPLAVLAAAEKALADLPPTTGDGT
ncbi:hypothetical protein [Streptomyces sp. MB09-02B]|uniref:hypothetical protein n=1 Tax=Streptomyces sp. MB09-02B TaxID=3028667 RepID=UPI0029BCC358|nr:hypothetical protein [Streptomyces sp. MB09-02B]MDX3638790.1 hypothetical protein [Streptomyces sp. MB09-02B]